MTILYNIYISNIAMKFCISYIQHWKFFRNIWTISYNHNFSIIENASQQSLGHLSLCSYRDFDCFVLFSTFIFLPDQNISPALLLLAPCGGSYLPWFTLWPHHGHTNTRIQTDLRMLVWQHCARGTVSVIWRSSSSWAWGASFVCHPVGFGELSQTFCPVHSWPHE